MFPPVALIDEPNCIGCALCLKVCPTDAIIYRVSDVVVQIRNVEFTGAAQSDVPALKAAGQLLKYCVNLKAAADRCEAWLNWREGRKDAEALRAMCRASLATSSI